MDTQTRRLALPSADLHGEAVLVTGGTGCVGNATIRELKASGVSRITSVSRGLTVPRTHQHGVDYQHVDVRDLEALRSVVKCARPDVVIHLAAVRDPALAEQDPALAVSTNVFGTANVFAAARDAGVRTVVVASTGKALRFFTPDVYAASKKFVELLAGEATTRGPQVEVVRFTHIVDNSIINTRLHHWTRRGEPVRLHGSDVGFYVQSGAEAAQLLVSRALPTDTLGRVAVQHGLGDPVDLLDLAVDTIAANRSTSAVEIVGFPPGYEDWHYPGTYSPLSAGDHSPLVSAFDARRSVVAPHGQYESFALKRGFPRPLVDDVVHFASTAVATPRESIKAMVHELGLRLLRAHLVDADDDDLGVALRARSDAPPSSTHDLIRTAIREEIESR